MKQGDIGTVLTFTVKDQDGTVMALTDATVTLKIKSRNEDKEVSCTVTNATGGIATYTTTSTDFTTAGVYKLELKTAFANGNIYRSKQLTVDVETKL